MLHRTCQYLNHNVLLLPKYLCVLEHLGSEYAAFLSNYNSTIRELLCSVPRTFFALMAARVLTSAAAMLPAGRELDEMFARLPLN